MSLWPSPLLAFAEDAGRRHQQDFRARVLVGDPSHMPTRNTNKGGGLRRRLRDNEFFAIFLSRIL